MVKPLVWLIVLLWGAVMPAQAGGVKVHHINFPVADAGYGKSNVSGGNFRNVFNAKIDLADAGPGQSDVSGGNFRDVFIAHTINDNMDQYQRYQQQYQDVPKGNNYNPGHEIVVDNTVIRADNRDLSITGAISPGMLQDPATAQWRDYVSFVKLKVNLMSGSFNGYIGVVSNNQQAGNYNSASTSTTLEMKKFGVQ